MALEVIRINNFHASSYQEGHGSCLGTLLLTNSRHYSMIQPENVMTEPMSRVFLKDIASENGSMEKSNGSTKFS